ncbi:hypothetical protein EOW65_00695 [Sinirhodobacter ferrireducens]|uniref:Uncharacterized protein n=1 Tax=Paenirhodobacter ferrireducens TaxID=1215032 RepID=A0A443LUY9_9RHOB|nr:hypothetical protein [Sinirhodobacter ferrireducens]RWR53017.1 hypothetical protein EOW65_00695 [Sinirhodobacter ferrireducens]
MEDEMHSVLKASVVVLAVAAGFVPVRVFAEPSCTDWMDQGDGTSWKECVDDSGVQHCYKVNNTPGSTGYEVSCSD